MIDLAPTMLGALLFAAGVIFGAAIRGGSERK